jgi:hypothetical protein
MAEYQRFPAPLLIPDGHSKCSTYGQSNCSTPVTVN